MTTKNMYRHAVIGLTILASFSCSEEDAMDPQLLTPQPDFIPEFIADNPQLVSFTNTTENAQNYVWDFGDESDSATQKHPTHYYQRPGIYVVTLKAANGDKSRSASKEINVLGIPTADFEYEVDNESALTLHFTNRSQHVTTYAWDFGDGAGSAAEMNPSYTYAEAGVYTVRLSTAGAGGHAETTQQIEVKNAAPTYDQLFIVGDASPGGWNIAAPEAFEQNESDPFIFTYTALLSPGEFKISTFTGDWCDGDWISPPEPSQPLDDSAFIVTHLCDGPDNKWVVTNETKGRYTITVDLSDNTVSFDKLTPQYSNLYILGDASPSGWNINAPEAFVQNDTDDFLFTYEGHLSPGNLKISTFTGDWCDGDWLNSSEVDQPLASADYIITHGCDGPDNQWHVTDVSQGDYVITVNLYDETIRFEIQ